MNIKFSPKARRIARRKLLQALYQWQMADADIADIKLDFAATMDPKKCDVSYFLELLDNITKNITLLEEKFLPFAGREVSSLDPITKALLRISVYELMFRKDVPYKVVINEALELAKDFGAQDSYKFVNGVLDKVAANLQG